MKLILKLDGKDLHVDVSKLPVEQKDQLFLLSGIASKCEAISIVFDNQEKAKKEEFHHPQSAQILLLLYAMSDLQARSVEEIAETIQDDVLLNTEAIDLGLKLGKEITEGKLPEFLSFL